MKERQVKTEWGLRRKGEQDNYRNRLRVLEIECRQELRMPWVKKMTIGETPENV
jgi:hypothetical protein